MPTTVEIPRVGDVEFPDSMSADEVSSASRKLYEQSFKVPEQESDFSKGRIASGVASAARGLVEGIGQSISGLGRFASGLTAAIPESVEPGTNPSAEEYQRNIESRQAESGLMKLGSDIQSGAREAYKTNPEYRGEFLADVVPSALGSTAAAASVGALTGPVGAAVQYGFSQAESQSQEVEAAGKPEQADLAFIAALPLGIASEVSLGAAPAFWKIVKKLRNLGVDPKVVEKPLTRLALETAGFEALQEGIEQVGQNVIAGQLYDPKRKTFEGVPTAMAAGAIVGGAAGTAGGLVGNLARRQALKRVEVQTAAKGAPATAQALASTATTVKPGKLDTSSIVSEINALNQNISNLKASQAAGIKAADEVNAAINAFADSLPEQSTPTPNADHISSSVALPGGESPGTAPQVAARESGQVQGAPEAQVKEEGAGVQGLNQEAIALLDAVDNAGGVPVFWTKNLRKIASDHGFEVTPNSKPNELIDFLRNLNSKKGVPNGKEEVRKEVQQEVRDVTATQEPVASTQPVPPVQKAAGVSVMTPSGLPAGPFASTTPQAHVQSLRNVSEIIASLAKALNTTVWFKRLKYNKAPAYFSNKQGYIASKSPTDFPSISHEFGHAIDVAAGLSYNPNLLGELNALGNPSTPGSMSSWKPNMPISYLHGEGVAELVRRWLADPASAKQMAPLSVAEFEHWLGANPDVEQAFLGARADINALRNADAESRLAAQIRSMAPERKTPTLSQLAFEFLDRLRYGKEFSRAAGEEKNTKQATMYQLMRLLSGRYGRADAFMRHGVVDFKTQKVALGTSFKDAIEPVSNNLWGFERYLTAKHVVDLHNRKNPILVGIDPVDAAEVIKKYDTLHPEFAKAADALAKWQEGILKYAVDGGLVTKETMDAWRQINPNYVPLHRVFELSAGDVQEGALGTGVGFVGGTPGSLQKLSGSTRPIISPLETMVKNAYAMTVAAEKANINRRLFDLIRDESTTAKLLGQWGREVSTPVESINVDVGMVRKDLEAAGADLTNVNDDTLLEFWRTIQRPVDQRNRIIGLMVDGKRKYVQLNKELFDTFATMDSNDQNVVINMLAKPANLLRLGVTLDPTFGLRNVFNDTIDAAITHGTIPGWVTIRGALIKAFDAQTVADFEAAGGSNAVESAYFDAQDTRAFIEEKLRKMDPNERMKDFIFPWRWPTGIIQTLRAFSQASEEATRLGEFKLILERKLKEGTPEGEARRIAAFEARDRQDFSMGGHMTKTMRRVSAFWNAGLQGDYRALRLLKENPARFAMLGMAYVTIPKLVSLAMNWNDRDYWDLPQWERDSMFIFPYRKDANGHTRFWRIPMPFVYGQIFGGTTNRIFEIFKGNKSAAPHMSDFVKQFLWSRVPSVIPNVVTVFHDLAAGDAGWSQWTGRQIVPKSLEQLPPDEQWTESSSLTARYVAKGLGEVGRLINPNNPNATTIAPVKIDYLIRGTTGGLGRAIVYEGIDRAIGLITGEKVQNKPSMLNRFFSAPAGLSSQTVDDFYTKITTLRQEKNRIKGPSKEGARIDTSQLSEMESAARRMAALRKEAAKQSDPDKKQAIYLRIVDTARQFVEPRK